MAGTHLSRKDFADPSLPTFADLIDRLRKDGILPQTTRQNWMWALRAVARASGKEPIAVLAHPDFLRKLLKRATPATIGLSPAAWNNARSLSGKALEWAGITTMPRHYQAPFAPSWAALWALLPPGKNALRMQLSRLFHYGSAQGISPCELSDTVITSFHEAIVAESAVALPYEIYRGTAKSWNNAAERIPGWPQIRLTVPSRQNLFCLPWDAFPPSLETDVESYLRRAEGLCLDDDHFLRAQRGSTLKTRRWQLRLLASAVVKSGIAAETLSGLPILLQPETAAAGLQYLRERNGGTSSAQISHVATFLPTLARRLDMDEGVVARLRKIAQKLKVTQHGMTVRNREALRAFDDPVAVDALVNLPQRLQAGVAAGKRKGAREAKIMQTALAIELLLNAPVRVQNLASINLEHHLVEVGAGPAHTLHLIFPGWEVKNRNPLEFPLMDATLGLLDEYLTTWWPLLAAGPTPFLFPGKTAERSKGSSALSMQIKELVFARTRLDLSAHRFRHAVGKIFLDRNPGHYEAVRQLLGHKSVETTIAFYAGAESATAARHYHRTILNIRNRQSHGTASHV